MDNNSKIKIESLDDDSPKVTLSSNSNHVPKVTLPNSEEHVPKVVLPTNFDSITEIPVQSSQNNVPKVTPPNNEEHVPKVVLPTNFDSITEIPVQSSQNNVPKVTPPNNEEHVPNVVLPEKKLETSKETIPQDNTVTNDNVSKSADSDKEKSNKIKNKLKINKPIIIAFSVVLVILALFIAYSNGLIFSSKEKESDNKKPTEIDTSKIPVDINSAEVVSMFSKFKVSNNCLYNTDLLNNDKLTRLRLAYENIDVNDFITSSCSSSSCDMNPEYCGEKMTQEMETAFKNNNMEKFREAERKNTTKAVTSSVLEAKYKELFGSDSTIIHESFGIGGSLSPSCRLMKYESSTSTYYYYNSGECSNNCSDDVFEEIKESYKKDDNLFIVSTYTSGHTKYDIIYEFSVDPETQMYVFKSATKN